MTWRPQVTGGHCTLHLPCSLGPLLKLDVPSHPIAAGWASQPHDSWQASCPQQHKHLRTEVAVTPGAPSAPGQGSAAPAQDGPSAGARAYSAELGEPGAVPSPIEEHKGPMAHLHQPGLEKNQTSPAGHPPSSEACEQMADSGSKRRLNLSPVSSDHATECTERIPDASRMPSQRCSHQGALLCPGGSERSRLKARVQAGSPLL